MMGCLAVVIFVVGAENRCVTLVVADFMLAFVADAATHFLPT